MTPINAEHTRQESSLITLGTFSTCSPLLLLLFLSSFFALDWPNRSSSTEYDIPLRQSRLCPYIDFDSGVPNRIFTKVKVVIGGSPTLVKIYFRLWLQ